MVEIIQPLEGERSTPSFKSKGEGINHVAYCVADLEKEASIWFNGIQGRLQRKIYQWWC
jgi:hypothetical protein